MRTTLNIDDDVLRAVKELARLQGATAGEVISGLAREALAVGAPTGDFRNGVPLFPPRVGEQIVTPGDVMALADDDGIVSVEP